MIAVVVTDHEMVDVVPAVRAQERQHDEGLASVAAAAEARTRVVQQHVMARLDRHRESLSDVENRNACLARRWALRMPEADADRAAQTQHIWRVCAEARARRLHQSPAGHSSGGSAATVHAAALLWPVRRRVGAPLR